MLKEKFVQPLVSNFKSFWNEQSRNVDFCKYLGFRFDYKKNEVLIHFKMLMSPMAVTYSAKEIASSDEWVESFSRKDVRLITFLACCELNDLSPVKMLGHKVESGLRLISLYDSHTKQTGCYTASDIVANKLFLSRIPHDQQKVIWYLHGMEQDCNR